MLSDLIGFASTYLIALLLSGGEINFVDGFIIGLLGVLVFRTK